MFFAADQASQRLGLSNLNIQIVLELAGQVDLDRLRRAVSVLHRVYPASAATCEYSLLRGLPRWRLDHDPPDPHVVTPVHRINRSTDEDLHRAIEGIYATAIDVTRRPGVVVHVLRGEDGRDVLLTRFAHKLMDARGATFYLEDLDKFYENDGNSGGVDCANEENRDDYARLLKGMTAADRIKTLFQSSAAHGKEMQSVFHLAHPPLSRDQIGTLRCLFRRLTPEQSKQIQDNAMRVCGFGRFGDYLRACAIRTFHRTVSNGGDGAAYTTLNLVNNRKRRERTPVCRNLTSAIPLSVPASAVEDIPRTADILRDQMLEQKSTEHGAHQFATLSLLMRTPTPIAGTFIHAGWTSRRRKRQSGVFAPPSLPLGIMGPFTRPMPTFCGEGLENYYGFATARPLPGFTIDVNITADRINICGGYYDGLIPSDTMRTLIDGTIDAALNPGS